MMLGTQLRKHSWLMLLSGLVLTGLVIRVWVLADAQAGSLDSDEAITGLMARHVLHGEFSVFFWGQAYGGSIESVLTAPLIALAGTSVVAIKLIPLALHALAGCFVWAIARELSGNRLAYVAATLFWVAPAAFIYRSVQADGFYGSGLVIGLAALLLIIKLSKSVTTTNIALLGLMLGLGLWVNWQLFPLVLPALAWIFFRYRAFRIRVWMLAPGFALGALPFIASNVFNNWHSLTMQGGNPSAGYLDRLGSFFTGAVTVLLGLRLPISGAEPILPAAVSTSIAVAVMAACIFVAWMKGGAWQILAVTLITYPFIYAAAAQTWYFADARYVYFLWPVIVIVAMEALLRLSPRLTVAVLLIVTVIACTQMVNANRVVAARSPPARLAGFSSLLSEVGADRVFADYWIAYKLTLESEEDVISGSLSRARYEPYEQEVRRAQLPAYVFVKGTKSSERLKQALATRGIGFHEHERDGMIVVVPEEKVLPEELGIYGKKPDFGPYRRQ